MSDSLQTGNISDSLLQDTHTPGPALATGMGGLRALAHQIIILQSLDRFKLNIYLARIAHQLFLPAHPNILG